MFQAILDLSFQFNINGILFPSINEVTTPLSNHQAMEQMDKVLWQIVAKVAECNPADWEILFVKWDIKDSFWQLVMSKENTWNFCYILPKINKENPIKIICPTCLQMGWCKSPQLFCMLSVTAQDVAEELCDQEEPLPLHRLKHFCIPD